MNPFWISINRFTNHAENSALHIRIWEGIEKGADGSPASLHFRIFDPHSREYWDREKLSNLDWEEAVWKFSGFINSLGCITWRMNHNTVMHGCDVGHAVDISNMITAIYWAGATHMTGLIKDVALPENAVVVDLD